MASEQQTPKKKSGVIGIIGRPSAGKSSLLNRICGAKVAITSSHPQTTRTRVRGIFTEKRGQLLFLDTPGFHVSEKKLNLEYQQVVRDSLKECDGLLYVRDLTRSGGEEEGAILSMIEASGIPWVAALNKMDTLHDENGMMNPDCLEILTEAAEMLPKAHHPHAVVETSAETGLGYERLLDALFAISPEGEAMYPPEYYTDQEPQFRISEIIREKAISRSKQEVPHSLYVDIADAEFDEEKNTLYVRAFLIVERVTQKAIMVGAAGQKIKAIRLSALRELNQLFDYKIKLDLRVKVQRNWRKKDPIIRKITRSGYSG